MPWIVVKFLESNEVEAVPSSWLVDKELGILVWPPFPKSSIEKAIKNAQSPTLDWKKFNIKLLSNKLYDSLATASAKAAKGCEMSEIESDVLPEKRIPKKKTYSSYSSEAEVSDEDLVAPPKPFQSGKLPVLK